MGAGHARPPGPPGRAHPSAHHAPAAALEHAPHHPARGHVPANKPSAPVPHSTRSVLETYIGNSDEFRAKLREKELEQARWLQEQQTKAAEDPVLSPAQIEEFAQQVNITSRPIESPHRVAQQTELTEGSGLVKELAANRRKALSRGRESATEDQPVAGKLTTGQLQQLLHMHASTWKEPDLAAQFKLEEHIVANIVKHYRLLRPDDDA